MNEHEILQTALTLDDPEQRQLYLLRACGGDVAMLQRLQAALQQGKDQLPPASPQTEEYTPPVPGAGESTKNFPTTAKGVVIDGRFRLTQPLGMGGMGEVWAAEQSEPVKRQVALKLIRPGMDSGTITARFEQERQALAMMDHPNIAKVLDAGTTDDHRPYFVMELVKGIPITKYCDQHQLSPQQRLELFIPICQAVQHAHQKGIIHRDLKPSNILIGLYDDKPVPKVIDFGVAKAIHHKLIDETMYTEIGAIVGTLEYMAPEQAELTNLDIDTRADIYSLGVILYELLAGSPPFTSKQLRGAAFMEMLRMIREVEPQKPSTKLSTSEELANIAAKRKLEPRRLQSLVKGELDWIVMKALEKDRSRRYETCNGLAMDIQRYLANEPVLAGPPSLRYRLKKYLIRNAGWVTAASLLVLTLIGGIVGTTWGLLEARRQRDDAIDAREKEAEQRRRAETERDRATQANAKASAYNGFLTEMFKAVELFEKGSKEATVLDLVKKASSKADKTLTQEPLVEAAVRTFLGNTLVNLGKPGEAMPELQKALELKKNNGEENTFSYCETLHAIGQAQHFLGQYSTSLATHHQSLAIRKTLGDIHLEERAREHHALANTLMRMSRYAEVEPHIEQAEILLRQSNTMTPAYQAYLLAMRGTLAHQFHSNLEKAEQYLTEAVALFRQEGYEFKVTRALNDLAVIVLSSKKYDQAIALYEEVLILNRKRFDDINPERAVAMENMANCWFGKKDYAKAASLLHEVAVMRDKLFGPGSFPGARTRFNQGAILFRQGKSREAIEIFDQVLPIFHKNVDEKSIDVAAIHRHRGMAYVELKAYDEAFKAFQAALTIADSYNKPAMDQRLSILQQMINAYRRMGNMDQATRTHQLALSVLDAKKPEHATWVKKLNDALKPPPDVEKKP